ncbi:MAG: PilZ domain-containing protein [Spirochaetaceae bacterium]|nr:PilZ domain-containing protein [Myxococcales bacterium]MCB9725098.1 PilZ domain-containing protein [Spirochaetaceae bacterium]HPG25708.1 PilZ domain-containing protein [Myxococcota bacterium]
MRDIATLFREYARLDLRRHDQGLSIPEHERWSKLRELLDRELGRDGRSRAVGSRRSAERVETRLTCRWASGETAEEAVLANLSTGGAFIRTEWPLPVGAGLRLCIQLEDSGVEIRVRGVVVSNHVDARGSLRAPGMGIRFVRVEGEALERLSALYSTALERGRKKLEPVEPPPS